MSYDFATEKICPHQVLLETSVVDPITKDVIRFQRPPNGSSVVLYLNGEEVPPGGLYSFPELATTASEPFRITSGKDDLLYLDTGSGARTVQLLTGSAIRAVDLAKDLSHKVPELAVTAEGGKVVFRARSRVNGRSFSFPDPRWTDKTSSLPSTSRMVAALARIGVVAGRVVTGRRLFPSWSLIQDPSSPVETDVIVRLSEPLLNSSPIAQLSYTTAAANCRRCFGLRIEFDYSVQNGTYETVDGADLLSQELDKFIFTKSGSHWKWPWIGSQLINRIGGKALSVGGSVNSMLSMDVSKAFGVYQNIKAQQAQGYPFQKVSDEEFPRELTDVSVYQPPDDPTVAVITATVVTRSLGPVVLKRVVGNPNPFTLLGQDPQDVLKFASQPGYLLRG